MPSPASIEQMLERLRRGDPAAFEEVLARYGGPLQAALRRIAPAEAEDIVQETFARLFQNVHRVRDLRAWLYTVAMNLARSRLRRPPPPEARPGVPEDPSDLRDALDAAIAALPEKARAAFVLREVAGLSTSEVAQAEGCSEEAVRQRLFEARRKLRESLGPLLERSLP